MPTLRSSAQQGRAPYEVTATWKHCQCAGPSEVLFRTKDHLRAVKMADGYWALYVAFFGHLFNLIHFVVTDTRDGRVIWRNGRLLVEDVNAG